MKPTPFMARQGDVLFLRVDADFTADPAKESQDGRHYVAMGETTNHAHYFNSPTVVMREPSALAVQVARDSSVQEARSILWTVTILPTETAEGETVGATLYHGTPTADPAGPQDFDHRPITLPPGTYLVLRQREWDDSNDYRAVAD